MVDKDPFEAYKDEIITQMLIMGGYANPRSVHWGVSSQCLLLLLKSEAFVREAFEKSISAETVARELKTASSQRRDPRIDAE